MVGPHSVGDDLARETETFEAGYWRRYFQDVRLGDSSTVVNKVGNALPVPSRAIVLTAGIAARAFVRQSGWLRRLPAFRRRSASGALVQWGSIKTSCVIAMGNATIGAL